jgi:general L-amino acid transport system substrate-binding protein
MVTGIGRHHDMTWHIHTVMAKFLHATVVFLLVGLSLAGEAQSGPVFDAVKARGVVRCGVNPHTPGFSQAVAPGDWRGLDVDLCRAIAAAVFGDAAKVFILPADERQRIDALYDGAIDILMRNATHNLVRDAVLSYALAGTNFYDGLALMTPAARGARAARDLDGAVVCTRAGQAAELLADFAARNAIRFTPRTVESVDDGVAAYESGNCGALLLDASHLAALRAGRLRDSRAHAILPDRLSRLPLGPLVRHGDAQWLDVVKWVLMGMVQAEELGVSSRNVDAQRRSDDPAVERLLGVSPGLGKAIGLDERWMYNVIKQVGNYGESYARHLGADSPLQLERGLNELWTRGGLMYAMPFR